MGSASEPKLVPRRDAFVNLYARLLIGEVDGDLNRIRSARARAEHEYPQTDIGGDNDAVVVGQRWIALCDTALAVIAEAGADTDEKARQRLVASAAHLLNTVGLGAHRPQVARD